MAGNTPTTIVNKVTIRRFGHRTAAQPTGGFIIMEQTHKSKTNENANVTTLIYKNSHYIFNYSENASIS